MFLISIYKRYF